MKFFVKLPYESIAEAIKAHPEGGYDSVESAKQETYIYEENGFIFQIVDENGKYHGEFNVTESNISMKME